MIKINQTLGGGGGLVAKSCPTLATPWTVTCQAPLSMGFYWQEYWSGCHFLLQGSSQPKDWTQVSTAGRYFTKWATKEFPETSEGEDQVFVLHVLYWNSQNTGVSSLSLIQGIFPIQGLNPGLPHCRQILY